VTGRLRAAARHPLARRLTGYSAGSVIAAVTGELAFVATYGWAHAGTTWATAAGFVAAAVPNYVLNRRWAWSDRRGRDRRAEVSLYLVVVLTSFAASAVATHWADIGAVQASPDRAWQTFLVAAAYFGVSAVFFVLKFVLYETVVFSSAPIGPPAGRTTR
jgi:putative flippase GtrA